MLSRAAAIATKTNRLIAWLLLERKLAHVSINVFFIIILPLHFC
jgi:hypothetical protein